MPVRSFQNPSSLRIRTRRNRTRIRTQVALIATTILFLDKIGSAERTCGTLREPDVDAISVEHVATRRHQTQRFLVLELAETNRTLHTAFPDPHRFHIRVDKRRERLYNLRFEPTRRRPSDPDNAGCITCVGESENRRPGVVRHGASAAEDGAEDHYEDNEEQDRYHYNNRIAGSRSRNRRCGLTRSIR